jgi:hypothetical protein
MASISAAVQVANTGLEALPPARLVMVLQIPRPGKLRIFTTSTGASCYDLEVWNPEWPTI